MKPKFWKLSHGTEFFTHQALLDAIERKLVYVHKDTHAKGTSPKQQGQNFLEAAVGEYFYLTHGNNGIYLLGQFSGPANIFSAMGAGWLDRPFRYIKSSSTRDRYSGLKKWWAPSDHSTFMSVPDGELAVFEECILKPYFEIALADFGI